MFGEEAEQQKGLFTFYREMHEATQQQLVNQKSIKHLKKSKILSKLNMHKKNVKDQQKSNNNKHTPQKTDNNKLQMKVIDRVNHKVQFLKHIVNHNHQYQRHKERKVLVSSKNNLKTLKTQQNPQEDSSNLYSLRLQQNITIPIKSQQIESKNHQALIKIISKKLEESVREKCDYLQNQYRLLDESQQSIGLGSQIPLNSMLLTKQQNINSLSIFVSQGKLTDLSKSKNHKTSKLPNKLQNPTTLSNLGNINDLIITNQVKGIEEKTKKSESPKPIAKQSIRFPNLQKKKQIKSSLSKQIQNIKQINVTKLESDGWKHTKQKYMHTQPTQDKKTKSAKSISKILPMLLSKQSKTQANQIKTQKPVTSLFFCQYVKQEDYNRLNSLSPKKKLLMKRLGFNFNI